MRRISIKNLIVFVFLLCALPAGVMMAVLTPPGQVPDEQAHMARAIGLLHGAVLCVRKPGVDPFTHQPVMRTGLEVDLGLFEAAGGQVTVVNGNPILTEDNFAVASNVPTNHFKLYVDTPNTAAYFPINYLPATLALAIGLAVKATPFTCFLMARLFMLATFLLLGSLALWFAAYGEAVLLTVLLLPMTLYLAGSVSQDATIVALTCLACAALSRGSRGSWLAGLLLFLPVLLSKPPYIPLLALFLLPLSRADFWWKLRGVALACLPVLAWVGLVIAFVAVPYPVALYHPGPLYPGNAGIWLDHTEPAVNFHILLAEPVRFITIPWLTLQIWFSGLIQELVGVLGLIHIGLPTGYYYLWGVCGSAALLGLLLCPRPAALDHQAAFTNSVVTLAVSVFTCWLLMVLFYINFTDAGGTSITGLQGRYFLPLLPFLMFALPTLRVRFKLLPIIPAIPTILLGLYDVGYLPLMIIKSYYLH